MESTALAIGFFDLRAGSRGRAVYLFLVSQVEMDTQCGEAWALRGFDCVPVELSFVTARAPLYRHAIGVDICSAQPLLPLPW
jgi:hypothetical protein